MTVRRTREQDINELVSVMEAMDVRRQGNFKEINLIVEDARKEFFRRRKREAMAQGWIV